MDPHPENNKKFAELVGICWHEVEFTDWPNNPDIPQIAYKCKKCGFLTNDGHPKDFNPDYATDPRVVLREMERIGKLMGFLIELNLGACGFIYSYIFDETGKFRDEAIEWIKEK